MHAPNAALPCLNSNNSIEPESSRLLYEIKAGFEYAGGKTGSSLLPFARQCEQHGVQVLAAAQAQQGQQVVAQVSHSMVTLERTAARIGTITGVIDDLAFQTNLLALNAAMPSRRAASRVMEAVMTISG